MWQDFLAAVALVLVIEGILPFASPAVLRQAFAAMATMDDRALRLSGAASMAAGVVLLYFVRT
jgi:uncharacterized protein YjeT (DUF2065 family)